MEKDRIVLVAAAVIAGIFLLGGLGMGGYGMMGFGMGFGFFFVLLFLGLVIWLISSLSDANKAAREDSEPLAILKRRYASGEITKSQYEQIKKELNR